MPLTDRDQVPSPFEVRSRVRDYAVEFDDSAAWVARIAHIKHALLIVDENVWRLHGAGVLAPLASRDVIELQIAEERKTFDAVAELAEAAIRWAAKRNATIVSIGGGITQDVTGFLASTLYRGVHWIYAPTTLLAMADSCIGGKTSLNLGAHKNLLGTVYPPERIVVHAPFVATLDKADYRSGLGEVVKLHLLGGEESLRHLRDVLHRLLVRDQASVTAAIRESLEIKRAYIEEDEFDRGRRNLLNFGHCFGHALETTTSFAVPHGQAVLVGMVLADQVASDRGLLDYAVATERRRTLYLPVLGLRPDLDVRSRAALVEAMKFDKKRTGEGLALVMVGDGLEAVRVDDLSVSEALSALERLPELLQP